MLRKIDNKVIQGNLSFYLDYLVINFSLSLYIYSHGIKNGFKIGFAEQISKQEVKLSQYCPEFDLDSLSSFPRMINATQKKQNVTKAHVFWGFGLI